MECRKVVELIPLMAGNDLAESSQVAEFKEHLTVCTSCANEMNEYREIIAAIATAKAPVLSGTELNAMWDNVSSEIEVSETPRQTVKLPLFAYAAVLVAGLGIGFAALVLIDETSAPATVQPANIIVERPAKDGISNRADVHAVGNNSRNSFPGMNETELTREKYFVVGGIQQLAKLQAENEKMRDEIRKLTEKINKFEKEIVNLKKGNSQEKDK